MRRKLVITCMAACMLCLALGCGTGNDNNVADGNASATNNNSSAELNKTDAVSEPVAKQKVEKQNDSNLEVDEEYKNLTESEGFVFESNGDGTCDLKEIGLCKDTDIVIPEKSPEGDVLTKIDEYAFYDAEDISSIIFAGRNLEIADNAFQSCEVEKLVISGCELNIGESAFSYCDDISSIYISNSTVNIDEYAFYDAGKNAEITIQNAGGVLDDNSFQSCAAVKLNMHGCTLELGEEVFAYSEDFETVEFSDSTVNIGSYAFYDAGDDMAVTFDNCGIDMDDNAFQSCGIVSLAINGSDTVLGKEAFAYCEDLADVVFGANNLEIGSYAFYDCTALTNVSIAAESADDNLEIIIDDSAFQSCAVQNVIIGCGNVKLGKEAFAYCEALSGVEFKGSALKVGSDAFYDCPDELTILYKGVKYNKQSIEDAV